MKKKKDTCHALEFAKQLEVEKPWMWDLKECEKVFQRSSPILEKKGHIEEAKETKTLARIAFTVKHKYSSIRKWDVGVRYMAEKQAYIQRQRNTDSACTQDMPGAKDEADGDQKHGNIPAVVRERKEKL